MILLLVIIVLVHNQLVDDLRIHHHVATVLIERVEDVGRQSHSLTKNLVHKGCLHAVILGLLYLLTTLLVALTCLGRLPQISVSVRIGALVAVPAGSSLFEMTTLDSLVVTG